MVIRQLRGPCRLVPLSVLPLEQGGWGGDELDLGGSQILASVLGFGSIVR